ncbi:MAG TPA: sugar ABC transporter substrate-binding protein [Anaerolineales bacterium]|nr:sugar ABC transporter substrate-binding protein [Anaerolineales bacterium]
MSLLAKRPCALLGFILLFAPACTARSGDRPVTFMVSGEPQELAAYQALIDAFAVEHPENPVNLLYVASQAEYRERLATMFSGNQPPDIFLYNYRRLGTYAADGAIHPVDGLLDTSDVLRRDDFYPIALEAFTYQGVLQCIPQNISSPAIFYNQALFDAAGLPFPEPGWTLDDFIATATALTHDLDGDGRIDQWGFGTEIETIRLAPFIWATGGDFFDDPQDPTALALSGPKARAAIEWFIALRQVHGVAPDLVSETAQSSQDQFLNGSVAMFMDSRVAVPALRTITAFEWDAAPLPLGDAFASVLHSDGFCMSARAAAEEAYRSRAWAFIEYALSETGQTILAGTGRTVPSMIRVAESPAYLESAPPAANRVWLDAAENMRALPMLPGWNTFEELFSKDLQRAFYGDTDLDQLLATALKLAEPLLRR